MAQNYPVFRGLLRGAICTRTQAQFANDSGISAEHLSRMLNADTIHRPTKATLHKIAAAAKNGVTFQDLMDALDKDDGTVAHPSELRIARAQQDFKPDFKEEARTAMQALCDVISFQNYPVIVPSIADHVSFLINEVHEKHYLKPQTPIAYEIDEPRPNFGLSCPYAASYVTVFLSMADRLETAASEMMINFTELPCEGDKVQYVIQKVSCAVKDISDQHGINTAMIAFVAKHEETGSDTESEPEDLEAALELPYYLDFAPVERFKETYYPSGESPKDRIVNKIFGAPTRWSETVDGFGLPIWNTPANLHIFLSQHIKPVLDAYDEPDDDVREVFERIETAIQEAAVTENPHKLALDLDDIGYQDPDCKGDKGWPAAVAEVMRAETGFPFYYHAPAADKTEFPGLSEYGCILISDADAEREGIQREALLFAVSRYARILNIKSFGDILFTGVHEVFRKPKTYVLRDEPNETENDMRSERPVMSVDFINRKTGPWPEEEGLYRVELKDGRVMTMAYLNRVENGAWVRAHQEWSHMIARYCPDKVSLPAPVPRKPENNTAGSGS